MTADNISRDEAIEIVGQELFGEAWVGELSPEEWQLAKQYKVTPINGVMMRPPIPAELSDKIYHAEERAARSDRQYHDVIIWLENRGLDCVRGLAEGLDRKIFAASLDKAFRRVLPRYPKTKYRHPGDAPLVQEAIDAVAQGRVTNPFQAAKLVCERADPKCTREQNLERLRKLIAKEWK